MHTSGKSKTKSNSHVRDAISPDVGKSTSFFLGDITVEYTPGPWAITDSCITAAGGFILVATPFNGFDYQAGRLLPILERAGNAHLIAAAPDLLAALRELTGPWERGEKFSDIDADEINAMRWRAAAAIAKAEGRS